MMVTVQKNVIQHMPEMNERGIRPMLLCLLLYGMKGLNVPISSLTDKNVYLSLLYILQFFIVKNY